MKKKLTDICRRKSGWRDVIPLIHPSCFDTWNIFLIDDLAYLVNSKLLSGKHISLGVSFRFVLILFMQTAKVWGWLRRINSNIWLCSYWSNAVVHYARLLFGPPWKKFSEVFCILYFPGAAEKWRGCYERLRWSEAQLAPHSSLAHISSLLFLSSS